MSALNVSDTTGSLLLLNDGIVDLQHAIDTCWLLACAYLVFIMQLGFALLEAGSVRAINTKNIIMQNILDTLISIIMWWLTGFGISQGYYSGGIGDMSASATRDPSQFALFMFLWAFNSCATTIVSGSVTSRIKFSAYMASCVVLSGFTFPIVAYWTWGQGWLGTKNPNGLAVIDFAGGTVVHIVGGVSGLVGAIVVGPRTGRWTQDADGKWQDNKEGGHSVVYATIGVFLLFFGWFGFNSGSTAALSNGQYLVAATCAVNTLLATAAGGIAITIHFIYFHEVHELWELLNGMLCGLVAITPCCATVPTWASVIIGATSIYAYLLGLQFVRRLRIDDVVDAFPVHGCCGIYGTLCAAFFSTQELCDAAYGVGRIDFRVGHQLGMQIIGCTTSIALAAGVQAALFLAIKYTVGIRVSEGDERVGLDFKYHAGYAYPDFNQRVKKAHEQIALESEIAAQVRKDMMSGKANKFKSAINSSVILPIDEKQMKEKSSKQAADRDSSGGAAEKSVSGGVSRLPPQEPCNDSPSHHERRSTRISVTAVPGAVAASEGGTWTASPQGGRLSGNAAISSKPTVKVSSRSPMTSPLTATTTLGNVGPLQLDPPSAAVTASPPSRPSRGVELTPASRQSTIRVLGGTTSGGRSESSVASETGTAASNTAPPYSRLQSTPSVSE